MQRLVTVQTKTLVADKVMSDLPELVVASAQATPPLHLQTPDFTLLDTVADDLAQQGYSVIDNGLPAHLAYELYDQVKAMSSGDFHNAHTGRQQNQVRNQFVRKDEICWIEGQTSAEVMWLNWCNEVKTYLNRTLYLGLFSFESHFAHYRIGDFYRTHVDAFKGGSNRVVSLVTYLNPDWQAHNGGELVIYPTSENAEPVKVRPNMGTVVMFLSEEIPHEVLPAAQDRFSIAGWFSINNTINGQLDPPT